MMTLSAYVPELVVVVGLTPSTSLQQQQQIQLVFSSSTLCNVTAANVSAGLIALKTPAVVTTSAVDDSRCL
jgi:hypothetical protein